MCVCECRCLWNPEEGVRSSVGRATGSCQLPDVGLGAWPGLSARAGCTPMLWANEPSLPPRTHFLEVCIWFFPPSSIYWAHFVDHFYPYFTTTVFLSFKTALSTPVHPTFLKLPPGCPHSTAFSSVFRVVELWQLPVRLHFSPGARVPRAWTFDNSCLLLPLSGSSIAELVPFQVFLRSFFWAAWLPSKHWSRFLAPWC